MVLSKDIYESVVMEENLPLRILHFSATYPMLLENGDVLKIDPMQTQFIPPHWHRSLELSYVKKGVLNVRIGKNERVYQDDELFLINSGEIHEVVGHPVEDFEVICFIISYDYLEKLLPNIDNMRFSFDMSDEQKPELKELMTKIVTIYHAKEPYGYLNIQAYVIEIISMLCKYYQTENIQSHSQKHMKMQKLHKDILSYIHAHYAEKLTLEILATNFHFSREHFSRIFSETFGKSFLSYLNEYRLYCAFPDIVNSRKTIEMISVMHGFPSSRALIKQFRDTYHETPMQYRKNRSVSIIE